MIVPGQRVGHQVLALLHRERVAVDRVGADDARDEHQVRLLVAVRRVDGDAHAGRRVIEARERALDDAREFHRLANTALMPHCTVFGFILSLVTTPSVSVSRTQEKSALSTLAGSIAKLS